MTLVPVTTANAHNFFVSGMNGGNVGTDAIIPQTFGPNLPIFFIPAYTGTLQYISTSTGMAGGTVTPNQVQYQVLNLSAPTSNSVNTISIPANSFQNKGYVGYPHKNELPMDVQPGNKVYLLRFSTNSGQYGGSIQSNILTSWFNFDVDDHFLIFSCSSKGNFTTGINSFSYGAAAYTESGGTGGGLTMPVSGQLKAIGVGADESNGPVTSLTTFRVMKNGGQVESIDITIGNDRNHLVFGAPISFAVNDVLSMECGTTNALVDATSVFLYYSVF